MMSQAVWWTIVGGIAIVLFGKFISLKPLQWIGQAISKIVIGAIFLFLLNVVGSNFGLHIPINPFTTIFAGVLGIPGTIGLVVIQQWLQS